MSVKMVLHPFLNNGVETTVDVEGKTTGDCIKAVLKQYPAMEKKMFAKPGQLKGYVEIMVNGKPVQSELGTQVDNGDTVSVLVFLAGG